MQQLSLTHTNPNENTAVDNISTMANNAKSELEKYSNVSLSGSEQGASNPIACAWQIGSVVGLIVEDM